MSERDLTEFLRLVREYVELVEELRLREDQLGAIKSSMLATMVCNLRRQVDKETRKISRMLTRLKRTWPALFSDESEETK